MTKKEKLMRSHNLYFWEYNPKEVYTYDMFLDKLYALYKPQCEALEECTDFLSEMLDSHITRGEVNIVRGSEDVNVNITGICENLEQYFKEYGLASVNEVIFYDESGICVRDYKLTIVKYGKFVAGEKDEINACIKVGETRLYDIVADYHKHLNDENVYLDVHSCEYPLSREQLYLIEEEGSTASTSDTDVDAYIFDKMVLSVSIFKGSN